MTVEVVAFDVGETLFDETRMWGHWADWIGVPRLTFFGALGAVIERGGHHQEVFDLVAPGFDLAAARLERDAEGEPDIVDLQDLYPDAIPCLTALTKRGYRVGIVGNQLEAIESVLERLPVNPAFIGSSTSWGIEKPASGFFQRIAETACTTPHQIAYVGDHLYNDILPARDFGMAAVFLRRGPWGLIHGLRPEVSRANAIVDSLAEVPAIIDGL